MHRFNDVGLESGSLILEERWPLGGFGSTAVQFRNRLLALALTFLTTSLVGAATNFFNFETAPVHPLALGPDGRTLALANLPDGRVEFFDVSSGIPILTGNVAVGIDPVTVRFASSNEVWVVNAISSTINIVDVAAKTIVATIDTPGGPSDLVFAGNPRRAWVSGSRANTVLVIDPVSRSEVATIPIDAERPRAMATSPDGMKVYVAIFESGNGTTVIGRKLTELNVAPGPGPLEDPNGPYQGANPPPNRGPFFVPPINPNLTNLPPRVSHIVRKNPAGRWLDDNQADWTEYVSGTNAAMSGRVQGWDLPDRDLAIIDTATLGVSYVPRLMNLNMAMAVNPVSGEISIVGTEAMNEVRFEPVLQGVFLRVNLALVNPTTRIARIRDLNPHLNYLERAIPETRRAQSLGDPRGIEWNSSGTRAYVTGMGSRNLVVVDAQGDRVGAQPIELGEGPTGMALDEARGRLYVWNRFSSTLSVVATPSGVLMTNVAVFDPTPAIIRAGRRHLYDTRATSGLGITACASCHVDARFDRLAWDLGDPSGAYVTNNGAVYHPMKGPMVTQTLQDIIMPQVNSLQGTPLAPLPMHWRGDRKDIEAFNSTFPNLQARSSELKSNEMAEFKGMLSSVSFPPNMYRTFSNGLPTSVNLAGYYGLTPTNGAVRQSLPAGNAQAAVASSILNGFVFNCGVCHTVKQGRSATTPLLNTQRNGTEGSFKMAQLRSIADKVGMDGGSANGRAGFGFMHDGRVDTLPRFLLDAFPRNFTNDQAIANMTALLLAFSGSDFPFRSTPSSISQDVPASAGRQVTFASPSIPPMLDAMVSLASATNSRLELVIRGKENGRMRSWLYRRTTKDFQADRHNEVVPTVSSLVALAAPGNEFTVTLVPEGAGRRIAFDHDGDGYFDRGELEAGSNPDDANSHPGLITQMAKTSTGITLTWQSAPGARYTIMRAVGSSSELPTNVVWSANGPTIIATGITTTASANIPSAASAAFFSVLMEP